MPTQALLGVDAAAAQALRRLDIRTVFDLATSSVFAAATTLTSVGGDVTSPMYQLGMVSADLVRGEAETTSVDQIPDLPIDVLQALPEREVRTVKAALDLQRVRELADYPPYRAAAAIVDGVFFPMNSYGGDPERPADLLPRNGDYPTERVQYTTLLLDEIKQGRNDKLIDLLSPAFSPISLGKLATADTGYTHVAFGALLTYNQSWYSQGVTLGQLLHSTALAPGESTRIAVVDWSRRSRAGQTEAISETEDLTQDTSHNRSISEVTSAVADEAQSGFSQTNTTSTSTQKAVAAAGEMSGGLVGSLVGGPSGSFGSSSSRATTAGQADSYSSSFGHREIGSEMAQKVADRTHQHAHASRSRRASVVKEVAQSEHEQVSTRVVTNYNHMHALTVQYYEVVQVYRVEVTLAKADRVVFIPVGLADFDDDALIRRFGMALTRAALTREIRDALERLDVIELAPDEEAHLIKLDSPLSKVIGLPPVIPARPEGPVVRLASTAAAGAASPAPIRATAVARMRVAPTLAATVNAKLWASATVSKVANLLDVMALRRGSVSMYLPTDISVEEATVTPGTGLKAVLYLKDGRRLETVEDAVPLSQVDRIAIAGSSADADLQAEVVLTLNRNGVRFPIELPEVRVPQRASNETRVVQVKTGGVDVNLKRHLNDHKLHYSQAIYRSLDASQIAWLLAGHGITVDDRQVPISQLVDPTPIRYIGNYLAFKMNSDSKNDSAWKEWLDLRGIRMGPSRMDIVPLGTGGVFAEAVLGRSNSAEKLDITRFWNWQDSPIPIQPSEIAAVQTGSRAMAEDIKPGQLSQPIVNITQPTTLPDPVGTAAVLAAIQNGNMFRDMSGLQATIGLAQSALQASAAGAASAAQQAGTNMQNHLQAQTERMRIAADLVKSLAASYKGHSSSTLPPSNHSQDGAKINYFDKTTGVPAGTGATPASSSGDGTVTTGGGHSGGGSPTGSAGGHADVGPNGSAGGHAGGGYSTNPGILAATWGDDRPPSQGFGQVVDKLPLPLQQVGDKYMRPAYTPNELAAIVGEVHAEDALKARKMTVFSDWRKHVSETGFDMAAYDPADKSLWIVDNKAYTRGIGGANALTGAKYDTYLANLRAFLKNTWPNKAEADLALAALDANKVKQVVTNGFSGTDVRFTRGVFEKGLHVFDIRIDGGTLYSPKAHEEWSKAFKLLTPRKGARVTSRGCISIGAMLVAVGLTAGINYVMVKAGPEFREIVGEAAATVAADLVVSMLPGGAFAAGALSLESDETSEQRKERKFFDAIVSSLPGAESLSEAELQSTRNALRTIIKDPLIIPEPPALPTYPVAPAGRYPLPLPPPPSTHI